MKGALRQRLTDEQELRRQEHAQQHRQLRALQEKLSSAEKAAGEQLEEARKRMEAGSKKPPEAAPSKSPRYPWARGVCRRAVFIGARYPQARSVCRRAAFTGARCASARGVYKRALFHMRVVWIGVRNIYALRGVCAARAALVGAASVSRKIFERLDRVASALEPDWSRLGQDERASLEMFYGSL